MRTARLRMSSAWAALIVVAGLAVEPAAAAEKWLTGKEITSRFTGNTLKFKSGPAGNVEVWQHYREGGKMFFTTTRISAGGRMETTWDVTESGRYCYTSLRFGLRCYQVRDDGDSLYLKALSNRLNLRASLIDGDPKKLGPATTAAAIESARATHPALVDADLPPLVPAKDLYSGRTVAWDHKISPDGRTLAWIEQKDGRPTIHLRSVDGPAGAVALNHPMPVRRITWALDSRHLLFFWNLGTSHSQHLFIADTTKPDQHPRDLTPVEGVKVTTLRLILDRPDKVLVRMNNRDGKVYDLNRLDLITGERELLDTGENDVVSWVHDREGNVRARWRRLDTGSWELYVPTEGSDWRRIKAGSFKDWFSLATNLPADGSLAYGRSNIGRDKIAMIRFDLETGRDEVVYQHPNVDVSSIWISRNTYEPMTATYHEAYTHHHYFGHQQLRDDVERALGDGRYSYRIRSVSNDMKRLTVRASSDRSGVTTFLLDRSTGKKEIVAEHPSVKHRDNLAETKPVTFNARDGLSLGGYLTLPNGTAGKNLPLVLKVHGGPWGRDRWLYDATTQFLANRGYAVLEVNFRGSRGFGRKFMELSRRDFGGRMQEDLLDGVEWAIREGYADPEKVAILGASYGGYAVLTALTQTPTKFAAGINVVGVSDLNLQARTFPRYSKQVRAWWSYFVGDHTTPEGRAQLAARSPITHVDKIERPLMIVHGARDTRVSKENSDRFVARLKEKDIPVEYVVFANEGHGIRRQVNQLTYARRLGQFLAEHLGGRHEAAE